MEDAVGSHDEEQLGYALKRIQVTLRGVMDDALAPLEMSVPQYVCLLALGRRPEASNAELARAAFVTRQSMSTVLRTLQERGLVSRSTTAPRGRALPTRLTPEGQRLLVRAEAVVGEVEARMLSPLSTSQRGELGRALDACTSALVETSTHR